MKNTKYAGSKFGKIQTNLNRDNLNETILILNPNSQGGNTGKNWIETYNKVKHILPKHHKIIFTKKANEGTLITRKLLKKDIRI